jgi:hypothetical protein
MVRARHDSAMDLTASRSMPELRTPARQTSGRDPLQGRAELTTDAAALARELAPAYAHPHGALVGARAGFDLDAAYRRRPWASVSMRRPPSAPPETLITRGLRWAWNRGGQPARIHRVDEYVRAIASVRSFAQLAGISCSALRA